MTTQRRDPFTPEELTVLREMIAERQYDQARSRFLGATMKRGRAIIIGTAAVLVFAMQMVTTLVLLSGGGGHP